MDSIITPEEFKDPIVQVRNKEAEAQFKLLGSKRMRKGHTMFEINLRERTIKPAKFEETEDADFKDQLTKKMLKGHGVMTRKNGTKKLVLDSPPSIRRKLIRNPDCIYLAKLNKKGVIKELEKRGIIKIVKKPTQNI